MAFGIRGTEEDLAAATNVSKSTRVRVYNSSSAAVLMTLADSEGATIGTMTLGGGHVVEIWKNPTETLAATADLLASPVTSNG